MSGDVLLKRVRRDGNGTFGELYSPNGTLLAFTLEPIVPLPAGRFALELVRSPRFSNREPYRSINGGLMLWICREPGVVYGNAKHHQLIHIGNTIDDTDDCVLVGSGHKEDGVIDSKVAYTRMVYPVLSGFVKAAITFVEITDDYKEVK